LNDADLSFPQHYGGPASWAATYSQRERERRFSDDGLLLLLFFLYVL
jgi:hypothetical protein